MPTVPGKYLLTFNISASVYATCGVSAGVAAYFRKNSTQVATDTKFGNGTYASGSNSLTVLVEANGSTDYFDVAIKNYCSGSHTISGAVFSGSMIGGGGGSDTLAGLSCSSGQIPKWSGTAWSCAADGGGSGSGDLGKDGFAIITASVTANTLPSSGSYVSGYGPITNCPAGSTILTTATSSTKHDWTNYGYNRCAIDGNGIKAYFLGTSNPNYGTECTGICVKDDFGGGSGADTLAGLSCTNGQIAKWNGAAWVCAADDGSGVDVLNNTWLSSGSFSQATGATIVPAGGSYNLGSMAVEKGVYLWLLYNCDGQVSYTSTYPGNHIDIVGPTVITSSFTWAELDKVPDNSCGVFYTGVFKSSGPGNVAVRIRSYDNSILVKNGVTSFEARVIKISGGDGSGGGGSTTAAGDEGQIQFNDGSDGFAADGVLHWDNTNKRLGIGTATPGQALTVSGSTAAIIMLEKTASTAKNWYISNNLAAANAFSISDEGDWRLTIASNGNVGIGTTTPSSMLEVQKDGGPAGLTLLSFGTTGAVNSSIINVRGTAGSLALPGLLAADARIGGFLGSTVLGSTGTRNIASMEYFADGTHTTTSAPTRITFATTPAGSDGRLERVRIDSLGNVGIGTTTPALQSSAGRTYLSIKGSSEGGALELVQGGADADSATMGMIQFSSPNNTNVTNGPRGAALAVRQEGATANDRGGRLEFHTKADGGALTEKMRINAVGNVGIGTTAPSARLQVAGTRTNTIDVANQIAAIGGDDTYTRFGSLAGTPHWGSWMQVSTDAGLAFPLLLNPNGGNVGIATTNPSAKLHIGTGELGIGGGGGGGSDLTAYMRLGFDTSYNQYIANNAYWTGSAYHYVQTGGYSGLASRINQNAGTISLDTQSSAAGVNPITWGTRLMVTNNGNVGIGTASPGQRLTVAGGIYSTGNNFLANSSPTIYLLDSDQRSAMIHNNSNTLYFLSGCGNGDTNWCQQANSYWPLQINLNNNDAVFGGNVYAFGYLHNSDQRLKKDIATIPDALSLVQKLRGVSYRWKHNDEPSLGVIAQEVEKVFPSAVKANDKGDKAVDYDQLIGPLIEAVKELKAANDNLRETVELQGNEIDALKRAASGAR